MSGDSDKKRSKANAAVLSTHRRAAFVVSLVWAAVRHGVRGQPALSAGGVVGVAMVAGAWGVLRLLAASAASADLRRTSGVGEYMFDVFYVLLFVLALAGCWTDRALWVVAVVPVFAAWKAWGLYRSFLAGGMPAAEQAAPRGKQARKW